jgi:hypothetical protein
MTTHVTIPATAMMIPTTIAVSPATFRTVELQSRGCAPMKHAAVLPARATERTAVRKIWDQCGVIPKSFNHCSSTRSQTVDQSWSQLEFL